LTIVEAATGTSPNAQLSEDTNEVVQATIE